mmetsp:Transcript_12973/g.20889  ORF Transcript_12973/g.20889 Transcript_12973/m.20889 type:complete len:194 (-) Transcript_12973:162-743(-)
MCNAIGSIFRLVIVLGCLAALLFQFLTMFNCEYIQFGEEGYASIGLWYYGVAGECNTEEYDVSQFGWFEDESWITGARSCLIMSMIFGAAACAMVTFEWCCCEVCCAGCLEGLAFSAAWISGGLAFGLYGMEACTNTEEFSAFLATELNNPDITNAECVWGVGSSLNACACICWFGCGLILCCAPQPDPICRK